MKRIAAKRGERSRKKRVAKEKGGGSASPAGGRARGSGSAGGSQEHRNRAEKAYQDSVRLTEREEFESLHFDRDLLTRYLKDTQKRGVKEPRLFLQEGVAEVETVSFLEEAKDRLRAYLEKKRMDHPPMTDRKSTENEERESATTARFVLGWLDHPIRASEIPFFITLFLRDVKDHPLADTGQIWKLIQPFLPSRIVTPDKQSLLTQPPSSPEEKEPKEKRDRRYPHIILPGKFSD